MQIPRKLVAQFDNCSENKNQFMMGFMSHLVEALEMDWIEMRFLVVGHTHCSIDQYFSVLSNFISKCSFLPTPLALRYALSVAHDKRGMRPLVVKPLNTIFDYKAFYTGKLATDIKYTNVPHVFTFERYSGKACMEYQLFSDSEKFPKRPPSLQIPLNAIDRHNDSIKCHLENDFCYVRSKESLMEFLEIPTTTAQMDDESFSKLQSIRRFSERGVNIFRDLQVQAINDGIAALKNEDEELTELYGELKLSYAELTSLNTVSVSDLFCACEQFKLFLSVHVCFYILGG